MLISLMLAASVATLERDWLRLNAACRGGNVSLASAVCRSRDATERALKRRGRCWEYSDVDVPPTEYRWHRCSDPRPQQ